MAIKKKFLNFIKSYLGFFLFGVFFIILFREFLYTYRMQLFKFIPYYDYQSHIIYYLTGDKNFDVQAPMNLRFLGLWVQFFIYKFIPCLELTRVKFEILPYPNYICATFSNALMNYISLCGILSLMFIYSYKKLKLSLAESLICLLFSFIFVKYVEAFTLDRISILYLIFILFFLDKPKVSIMLVFFTFLVNEKIIFLLFVFFFIKFYFQKDNYFKKFFFVNLTSGLLAILIFYLYSKVLGYGYFQSNEPEGLYNTTFSQGLDRILYMFKIKAGLSNAILPILFSISPYIIGKFLKYKKINYSNYEFLIPISLILFGAGGGMGQIGRYVMYSFPLWVPILSCQLYIILRNKK
jgi:hypothetical protein